MRTSRPKAAWVKAAAAPGPVSTCGTAAIPQSPVTTDETLPMSERSGAARRTSAKLRPRPRSELKYGLFGGLPTGLRVVATRRIGLTSMFD